MTHRNTDNVNKKQEALKQRETLNWLVINTKQGIQLIPV